MARTAATADDRAMWWKTALSWTWRLLLLVPLALWAVLWVGLDGTAGETWGWWRVAAVLVPVHGLLALALFWTRRRARPWVTGGAVVVALLLTTWLWSATPMMASRLRQEVDGVAVPGELVDTDDSGFDPIWGTDPTLTLTYRFEGDADDAVRALAAAFEDDGWTARADEQWDQVFADRDGVEAHAFVDGGTIDLTVSER